MRKNLVLILLTSLLMQARSQSVGIGTGTPNPSAQLEISSATKGVLISRMTTVQRKAIVNPAVGLLVYDLDKKTIYMYDNNKWQPLMFSTGDQKLPPFSLMANDVMDGDGFGGSVSISGDYAIVGSPLGDADPGDNKGCAYIFFKSGGLWTQQAKIVASDGSEFEGFGFSVHISGNLSIIGAPFITAASNVQHGKAYVFVRSGTTWTQQGLLTPGDGAANDQFGYSVSISGNFALVGSPNDDINWADQGSAYIFNGSGGWSFGQGPVAKLTANDGSVQDNFGYSVDISGDYLIVGSRMDDGAQLNQGSAYIYYRFTNAAGWSTGQIHQAKLLAPDAAGGDLFGYSVSISPNYAVVGAPENDIGSNSAQGSAYVFVRSGVTWPYLQNLTAPDGEVGLYFGSSVQVENDYLVIGASLDDEGVFLQQGSAYLFKHDGSFFVLIRKIDDENPGTNARFGNSVGISGLNVLIGIPGKNANKGEIAFLNLE